MHARASSIALVAVALTIAGCERKEPAPAKASKAPVQRPAPESQAQPAALSASGPIHLFNGKDLTGWKAASANRGPFWRVGTATPDASDPRKPLTAAPGGDHLINTNIKGADLYTEQKFRDFKLELEFMLPAEGNSGVFLLGQYELQIEHDPSADPTSPNDMNVGAVPHMLAPRVLAPIVPGRWHTYEIDFRAPRFDTAGKKTENARLIRVAIDGVVLHENAEIPGATLGSLIDDTELPEGPILLQGNHSSVAFRNIVITPRP
jgi:hypothetical protein